MGLFVDLFGLNIALLSVLVLIFAWILHKRRTAQIQLWFLGWLLLLVNAASDLPGSRLFQQPH